MDPTKTKAAPGKGEAASENLLAGCKAPLADAAAEAIKPNVVFCKATSPTAGLVKLELAAKAMGWGRNRLIARLKKEKILQHDRTPYQYYVDQDYFRVIERDPRTDPYGNQYRCFTTLVTVRGQAWLMKRYAPWANGISHESEG